MLKVGLTGGIGCGKSTAVECFRAHDVPIIDADVIAKSLLEKGQPALLQIENAFGKSFIEPDGTLNRLRLKKEVFSNTESLQKLEDIIHPRVKNEITQQLNRLSDASYALVDIPLLVEKGYCVLFDRIIVVDCLPQQQFERVSSRDQLEEKIIQSIMATQANRADRLKAATDILDNTGSADQLCAQVIDLHQQLTSRSSVS